MTSVGEERTGPGLGARSVEFTRIASGRYAARNPRGGELTFGSGDDSDFTPVEQRLVKALGWLQAHTDGRLATLRTLLAALAGDAASDHEALQRMRLDAPRGLRERLAARLVAHALRQA